MSVIAGISDVGELPRNITRFGKLSTYRYHSTKGEALEEMRDYAQLHGIRFNPGKFRTVKANR